MSPVLAPSLKCKVEIPVQPRHGLGFQMSNSGGPRGAPVRTFHHKTDPLYGSFGGFLWPICYPEQTAVYRCSGYDAFDLDRLGCTA